MIKIKKIIFFTIKSGLALVTLLTIVLFFYAAFFFEPPSVEKKTVENEAIKSEKLSDIEEEKRLRKEEEQRLKKAQAQKKIKVKTSIEDGLYATVGNKAITKSDIINEIKLILILTNKTFSEDKMDMGLLISDNSCSVAGVFTKSSLVSPSVTVNRETIAAGGSVRGLVVNSGIANAGVGEQGYIDAKEMASIAADGLGVKPDEVLVFSTGVIGVELPMTLIKKGVDEIKLSDDGGNFLARSMMTTDTRTKETGVIVNLGGTDVNICGVAKGSGMIHPNMATMLCFVATDAAVDQDFLRSALPDIADSTLNMLDIDGDTSTNDTLLCMANGIAGNRRITRGGLGEGVLERALTRVMRELALKIVADSEGAKKLVEIRVDGARTIGEARKVAFTVANSKLVKTAFFGEDPNVGRFMMAVGNAGVPVVEKTIDIALGRVRVVRRGVAVGTREAAAAKVMQRSSFTVRISLGMGDARTSVWTSDLGFEYVRINSDYRT